MNNRISYLDNFISKLNKYNSKYEYISGYENDNSKVKLRCKDCGEIIERWASSARSKKQFRCFNCERVTREQKQQKHKQEIEQKKIQKELKIILSLLILLQIL